MTLRVQWWGPAVVVMSLATTVMSLAMTACSPATNYDEFEKPKAAATKDEDKGKGKAAEGRLEPYKAPPLAELEAKAEWIDLPVVDPLKELRQLQETEPVLASAEEAVALRNDSAANNEKILSALGRLPKDEAQVNWDASITRYLRGDVKSTNPLMQNSTQEFDLLTFTSLGLFGFDWEMKPFALAEAVVSWQTSKDRMYDKVVMRDDLTWSDGKPVTAHDVVFSFQTIMDPEIPVPAVRSGTDKLRWVEAYDNQTVVFFHKESLATNIWNVNFPIIPKHVYESTIPKDKTVQESPEHVRLENSPVCGGPYTIASRTRGQEMILRRRDDWYMHGGKQVRDKPYFKEVRLRVMEDTNTALLAIKTGELDDLELTAEQWQTQTNGDDFYNRNTKATGAQWVYFYFGWNCKSLYFSDARVREAMSYAFDHDEMLNKLNYGLYQPCSGIFHPDSWMAPKNAKPPYKQDLDKAESLLDAAGWTDHDGNGVRDKTIDGRNVPFEFTIICMNAPERVALCTLLKENLSRVGVICNVRPLESTVLQENQLKHKFDAYFGGWGTGTDPDTAENLWKTGEERNFVQYANPEVDRLYVEGRKEFDQEKRAAIYARIHELIYADQPYTFLYYQSSFYGFNKQLRGYKFSPRGPYHYNPGMFSIWRVSN